MCLKKIDFEGKNGRKFERKKQFLRKKNSKGKKGEKNEKQQELILEHKVK